MIGYKLTNNINILGEDESFCAPCEGCVVYEVGKTTKPREGCGPLAAFDTKKQAMDYIFGGDCARTIKLWRCDYEPSQGYTLFVPGIVLYPTTGTVFADSITLLEEIKWRT